MHIESRNHLCPIRRMGRAMFSFHSNHRHIIIALSSNLHISCMCMHLLSYTKCTFTPAFSSIFNQSWSIKGRCEGKSKGDYRKKFWCYVCTYSSCLKLRISFTFVIFLLRKVILVLKVLAVVDDGDRKCLMHFSFTHHFFLVTYATFTLFLFPFNFYSLSECK